MRYFHLNHCLPWRTRWCVRVILVLFMILHLPVNSCWSMTAGSSRQGRKRYLQRIFDPSTPKLSLQMMMAKGTTLQTPKQQQHHPWKQRHESGWLCDRRQLLSVAVTFVLFPPAAARASLANTENGNGMMTFGTTTMTTAMAPSKGVPLLDNRPYAPIEALLPATKQRMLLEQCAQLAHQLVLLDTNSDDSEDDTTTTTITGDKYGSRQREGILQELKNILEPPNTDSYVRGDGSLLTILPRYTMQQQASSSSFKLGSNQISGKSIRSAMNIYTANLQFGESYVLTATPDVRKQLIRNDQLPNVKQVIIADLDLRDLYRNQIQTLVEDAQAELYYSNTDKVDVVELKELLEGALNAWRKWFDLISPNDVQSARTALSREEATMALHSK